ncbi:MAG: class III poly(R)-hydroxyalkanoic acid synthase subunit PhaC [Pseudomonadota bacterium]|nr:class III poly(R)-hydroxyalkanoic acid synthase subunit PhaC [Pseudomonadota bacterium]
MRFAIEPAQAMAEMAEFSRRMTLAASQLGQIDVSGEDCTPREAVHRDGKAVLWRYRPLAPVAGIAPLVICYALVNRPYMLDLQPDRSLIRGLLSRGLEVYLVDWGSPAREDRDLTLADYIARQLGGCIDHVREAHRIESVNLLGVCQGGTMSLCHAALFPERVRNLVTMVTPVDFQTEDNLLSRWAQGLDVDRLVAVLGNVPGELLNAAFLALMPLRLTVRKYAGLADIADDREALANFLRMERWIHDSPDQAGAAFAEFVRLFFQQNRLVRGGLSIGGMPVDLRRIACPLLNIYATQDHLVPPSASRPLAGLTGSRDYSTFEFDGGHIGIYVSRSAQERLPRTIVQWLERH